MDALGELVSNSRSDFPKDLIFLLLLLAVIAGALVTIFTFVAAVPVGEATGLVLFVAVAGLLMAGYMVGLMVLGLVMVPLAKLVRGLRDQRSMTKPT